MVFGRLHLLQAVLVRSGGETGFRHPLPGVFSSCLDSLFALLCLKKGKKTAIATQRDWGEQSHGGIYLQWPQHMIVLCWSSINRSHVRPCINFVLPCKGETMTSSIIVKANRWVSLYSFGGSLPDACTTVWSHLTQQTSPPSQPALLFLLIIYVKQVPLTFHTILRLLESQVSADNREWKPFFLDKLYSINVNNLYTQYRINPYQWITARGTRTLNASNKTQTNKHSNKSDLR